MGYDHPPVMMVWDCLAKNQQLVNHHQISSAVMKTIKYQCEVDPNLRSHFCPALTAHVDQLRLLGNQNHQLSMIQHHNSSAPQCQLSTQSPYSEASLSTITSHYHGDNDCLIIIIMMTMKLL